MILFFRNARFAGKAILAASRTWSFFFHSLLHSSTLPSPSCPTDRSTAATWRTRGVNCITVSSILKPIPSAPNGLTGLYSITDCGTLLTVPPPTSTSLSSFHLSPNLVGNCSLGLGVRGQYKASFLFFFFFGFKNQMSSFLPDLRFLQAEKRKKASCDRPRTQYHTEIMFDTWNQENPPKLLESLPVHESGLFFYSYLLFKSQIRSQVH